MVVIESLDNAVHGKEGCNITYRQLIERQELQNINVAYNADMFYLAIPIIVENGFAVADDKDGNHIVALRFEDSTYMHRYKYAGGVDLSFLNQYDCLFLFGCNEFSVELCQSALRLWKGKRLVLVGEEWAPMIEFLDDIPGMECFYEPKADSERFVLLSNGCEYLCIMYGLPHEENISRYEQRIMYYDEVMSFTFMFSDYRNLGKLNPDKKFFVMDGYYSKLGLFTIFSKVETCARYAKSKGMIPIIRLTMSNNSFYSDKQGEDIWRKFYNQPEGYTLEEVMNSRHVFFSPGFYNGSVQSAIMNSGSNSTLLTWPNGIFNDRIKSYIRKKQKAFLPCPQKTLGVLARGTDFVNTHLHNHPIHASKELICQKIDEVWETWGDFEYIYVATEDASYCKYFKERYGDKVFFTDQERYVTKKDQLLAELHTAADIKRAGFDLGAEYILSINLLSKCNSLIASGGCSGVGEALKENGGKYENVYIFNLGKNA